MPELPTFKTKQDPNMTLTIAELSSVYNVLRNHVLINESTKYPAGSNAAFQLLRIRSVVRKFEAVLDAQADHQLRTDAKSSES